MHPRDLALLLACAACPGDDRTTLTEPTTASGPTSSSGATGGETGGATEDTPTSTGGGSTSGGSDETAAPMTTAPAGPCDDCGPTEICVQEFDGFCEQIGLSCQAADGCDPPGDGESCSAACSAFCADFCGDPGCPDAIAGALQCAGL